MEYEFPTMENPVIKENGDYTFMPHFQSTIPTIRIDSEGGKNDWVTEPNRTEKWDYVGAKVSLDCEDEGMRLDSLDAEVKVRGNYTANYDKKPIRIKFAKKQSMLGLNGGQKFKNWVLLADVKDSSMTRNLTAFFLGHRIAGSDGYYCSDFHPVRVEINGQYWGVYLLVEQQENKTGRAHASEMESGYTRSDVGYFFEFDGYYYEEGPDGDPTFTIDYHNWSMIHGPQNRNVSPGQSGYTIKSDINSQEQLDFVQNHLASVYDIAYEAAYNRKYYDLAPDGYSKIPANTPANLKDHIGKYIDLNSLVDAYLVQEITCDPDIGWSSFYLDFDMSEGQDHRLRFEAPWDYDSAFGVKKTIVEDGQGYYAFGCSNPWLTFLTGQSFFQEMAKAKWAKLVETDTFGDLYRLLRSLSNIYKDAYAENYVRWPHHLTSNPSRDEIRDDLEDASNQAQASAYMLDWLGDRLTAMSRLYGDRSEIRSPTLSQLAKPKSTPTTIEAETGGIYGRSGFMEADNASGGQYVTFGTGTSGVKFNLDLENEQTYMVSFVLPKQVNTRDPMARFRLRLNDQELPITEALLERKGYSSGPNKDVLQWGEALIGEVTLPAGNNVLDVRSYGKALPLDYISLYPL